MFPEDKKALVIAQRTRKNLKFIEDQKKNGADVEEFTHLLNSMLGMVICLREEYIKSASIAWEDLEKKGLARFDVQANPCNEKSPCLVPHRNFSQLITNTRHAFAHNCFALQKSSSNEISGITLWNIPNGQENQPEFRSWEITLSEQQLKGLALLFMDYVEQEFAK